MRYVLNGCGKLANGAPAGTLTYRMLNELSAIKGNPEVDDQQDKQENEWHDKRELNERLSSG
jgi:hypothetical protein